MPTSKLPVEFVPVPRHLYILSGRLPGVCCNLRPEQRAREEMASGFEFMFESAFVHKPVLTFLKTLQPKTKVLMHFQGYGIKDHGTALVSINSIYWSEGDYPRLDFKHPPGFDTINGCPNFWGAFILAITLARDSDEEFAKADKNGWFFGQTVTQSELAQQGAVPLFTVDDGRVAKRHYVQLTMGDNWACSSDKRVCSAIADFLNQLPPSIDPMEVIEAFGRGKPHGKLPLPE